MKKNILFIGYGSISRKHISNLNNNKKFKIFLISNHQKKLSGINIIDRKEAKKLNFLYCFICNSSNLRLETLKILRERCKFFFLEKPISNNYKKARLFFKDKKNLSFKKNIYVGYVFQHHKLINYLKNILKKIKNEDILNIQIISRTYLPDWRKNIPYQLSVSANKKKGGGVLLELSHEINLLIYFFGLNKIKILFSKFYNSKKLNIDVEEYANIICRINTKTICNILLDFNCLKAERRLIINAKNKNYDLDLNKNILKIKDHKKTIIIKSKNEKKKMFKNQIDYFLHSKPYEKSVNNALETLRLIDEIKKN